VIHIGRARGSDARRTREKEEKVNVCALTVFHCGHCSHLPVRVPWHINHLKIRGDSDGRDPAQRLTTRQSRPT
jgi:hypothetical protein